MRRAAPLVAVLVIAALLVAGLGAGPATGAPRLVEVGRFESPVHVASPPGDLRLFVVEQDGRIRVLDANGTLLPTPFLDLTREVSRGYERGLLSLAFAPDYAASGRAYVFLTAATTGQIQVREYRRSASDPNRLDPATMRLVLTQNHAEFANHNGGGMLFGPDGLLWITIGDGGSADDPGNDAQSGGNLLGKLLRVNPTGPIPPDNPYASATDGFRDEIWAWGLRNPWRFSFDRDTGDLVVADVGQGRREEIDFAPAAQGRRPGANYGWRCWEGTLKNMACDAPGHVPPVHELDHDADGAVSITGGFVVRDPGVPSLAGRYLYGDIGLSKLRSLVLGAGGASGDREEDLSVATVSSFAEDACGRILVVSLDGPVYRLVEGDGPSPCPRTQAPTPPAPPPAASCGLQVGRAFARTRRSAIRDGLAVRVRVRARCSVGARAALPGGGRLQSRARELVPGQAAVVRVRLTSRARRALRRSLARRSSVRARLVVHATPPGGATAEVTRGVRIRR